MTAGWGNVGRAVVARLQADGHRVTVLDGRPTPEGLRADRHVAGRSYSLESVTEALEGAEAVIHLEWSGGVHEANQDPGLAHDRNSTGFLALLERCRQDGRPLIYASSGVYPGDRAEPWPETTPLATHSVYAVQKSYAEGLLRSYVYGKGVSGASLRIANVYGPGARPTQVLPRLRAAIEAGEAINLTGDGGQVRDFIHADDVARAFAAGLTRASELKGEPINVGTGVGTSMLELARLVMRLMGREVEIRYAPARGEESRYLTHGGQRAAERLGWRAEVSLEEGLSRSANRRRVIGRVRTGRRSGRRGG